MCLQGLQRRLKFDAANLTASPAHNHIIAYMAPQAGGVAKSDTAAVKEEPTAVAAAKSLRVDALGMVDVGLIQAGSVH